MVREEEYFLLDITRNFGTKIIKGQLALTCMDDSTAKEAKEYFSNMDLHCIPLQYKGDEVDQAIELVIIGNYRDICFLCRLFVKNTFN